MTHNGHLRTPFSFVYAILCAAFSEPECGHHYARSMASWAIIPSYIDFQYSGVEGKMQFTDRKGTWFWSNGYSWGTMKIGDSGASLSVLKGELQLKSLLVGGKQVGKKIILGEGETFHTAGVR